MSGPRCIFFSGGAGEEAFEISSEDGAGTWFVDADRGHGENLIVEYGGVPAAREKGGICPQTGGAPARRR